MKRPNWLPRLRRSRDTCPECGASVKETYCTVCGFELVEKTRQEVSGRKFF
jgi:ribosomal protein L37E